MRPLGVKGREAKARGHRNQTRPGGGRGEKRGWGKRQHIGANEKEEREGKADKKTEIRLIRFLRKTKPK